MATARLHKMSFDTWWDERIVEAHGAEALFNDLYADHCEQMGANALGRQAFVRQLNLRKVREDVRSGVRWRLNVKLREEAPPGLPARLQPVDSGTSIPAPMFRVTPYNPGEGGALNAVMLECADAGAEASARIAHELFGERRRQVTDEGRTPDSDDGRFEGDGDLANGAAAYAFAAAQPDDCARFLDLDAKLERPPIRRGWMVQDFLRAVWPWSPGWFKAGAEAPGWRRRCLVKAGALIIAAIEKLDRAEARGRLTAEEQRAATGV